MGQVLSKPLVIRGTEQDVVYEEDNYQDCFEQDVDDYDAPNIYPYKRCYHCEERKSCGSYNEDKEWLCEDCGKEDKECYRCKDWQEGWTEFKYEGNLYCRCCLSESIMLGELPTLALNGNKDDEMEYNLLAYSYLRQKQLDLILSISRGRLQREDKEQFWSKLETTARMLLQCFKEHPISSKFNKKIVKHLTTTTTTEEDPK